MTKFRATDRATGMVVDVVHIGEGDDAGGPAATAPTARSLRSIVLPLPGPQAARGRTAVEVVVAGWRFEFEVEDARLADLRERATVGRDTRTHDGPTEVRAIIPGRVLSVAVAVGDVVTAGQRLLAVEAMKMENELRAPRDGTVERIAVAVGETIDLGDPLVVLR